MYMYMFLVIYVHNYNNNNYYYHLLNHLEVAAFHLAPNSLKLVGNSHPFHSTVATRSHFGLLNSSKPLNPNPATLQTLSAIHNSNKNKYLIA